MGLLDWDHNAYYHRLLMRQLPAPCSRVLDVGCGAGAFAAELATRAGHVDALDRSPEMIEAARQITPAMSHASSVTSCATRSRLNTTTRSCRSPRCITCLSTTRCGACPAPYGPAAFSLPWPCPGRTWRGSCLPSFSPRPVTGYSALPSPSSEHQAKTIGTGWPPVTRRCPRFLIRR